MNSIALHSLYSEWRNDLLRIEKQIENLVTNDMHENRKQWMLWFIEHRHDVAIADSLPLKTSWDEPVAMLTFLRQAYEAIENHSFTVITDLSLNRTWIEWIDPADKIGLAHLYRLRMNRNTHLQVTYHQDLQRFVRDVLMFKKLRSNSALHNNTKTDIISTCTNDSEPLRSMS